jgi:hypothetical protein
MAIFCGICSRRSSHCVKEGVASGQLFAADASLNDADANPQNSSSQADWTPETMPPENGPCFRRPKGGGNAEFFNARRPTPDTQIWRSDELKELRIRR